MVRSAFVVGCLTLCVCAVGLWVSAEARPEGEPPEGWIRVTHPVHPITFEIPHEMRALIAPAASLGRLRARNGIRHDVLLFVHRPMGEFPRLRHALEVVFLWVTRASQGADRDKLASLGGDLRQPEGASAFVRELLYPELPYVELSDRGALRVAGHRARRVAIARKTLPGTPHEREVHGEAVVVQIHPAAALLVLGRFDESATVEEQEVLFPQIVRSVRLEDEIQL
jgi:hypothetical protein